MAVGKVRTPATPTPTPTATPNVTPTPSVTPTATPNVTPTPSVIPTATPNVAPTPGATPTPCVPPIDLAFLERDPGLRRPIWKYPPNVQDDIRLEYIRLGPCQPQLRKEQYPPTQFGNASSQVAFTVDGFRCWKRVNDNNKCSFLVHVGTPNSAHGKSVKSLEGLQNVTRHIDKVINSQSLKEVKKNRLRLRTTIKSVLWLTLQACALRGHDESSTSRNRGNLTEMIKLMGRMNVDISNIVLENAPKNAMYIAPTIQKDIQYILASKVRKKICDEIGRFKFCILVDEAIDASRKEQMAIVLRFVDVHGVIRERFFDIVNVSDTTSATLKKEVSDVLTQNNLSIYDMRGQGYDGASNMRGAFNGLQALFLKDCPYAYYVHCFAHRLQLALVGAVEKQDSIWDFFPMLSNAVNVVTSSSKRLSELQIAHGIEVDHSLASRERETGRGLNHIGNLQRAGSTRWSSHFKSICSLIDKYSSILTVLESIITCSTSSNSMRGEARGSLNALKSFKFIFVLYLMHKIMGITNLLCRALQTKSIDILNVVDLVATTKELLQSLRADGFDVLLEYVISVCEKFKIDVPDMNSRYMDNIHSVRQRDDISIEHHYHYNIFNSAIDYQVEELNYRFNDNAVELLRLSSSLESKNNFSLFDIEQICTLASTFYPADFSQQEMYYLKLQLDHYKIDVIRLLDFRIFLQSLSYVYD
ncbi:uncharacterized protein LOC135147947 [Daucus carota subsp. sativus]|uniref:uncharacterized protein LOC135147947 n=1 Tax=Daucus carota subsp. sativus TaxID=79200 RepID=UPI003082D62C